MRKLLLIVLSIFSFLTALAQVDTEFWFAAPHICEHSRVTGGYHMVLFSYDKPAHIELSMPANSAFVTKTYDLNAYDYVDIEMAQDYDDAVANLEVPFDVVSQRGIHITSTSKIGGYYNHTGNNAEAYSLKNEALGTEFGVVSQTVFQIQSESETYEDAYSSAQIVATEDNTIVTITPVTGHPVSPNCNATPIVVHLNRGETYAVRSCSKDPLYGVNGMRISSNKPIAVCSTDDSTQAGTGAAGLDLTGEQLVSLDFAGKRYAAIGQQNSWNSCSITALENGTTVTLSTGQVLNMQKDETQNISMATVQALYIESNKDVLVYQITGEDDEAAGTMLPALDCTGSRYVAYKRMPDSYMTFLNIVTKSSNINSIYINNSKVASSQFHPVPGTGNALYYASIQKSGADDFLTVECKSGFIQLGVLDMKGTSLTDLKSCTYGYFSDYGTAHEYDEYAYFDEGGIYTWPNHYRTDGITPQTFTDEGIYKDTLTDNNGCDSICVLHLSKIPYPDNIDDATGCMVPPSTNVWSIRQKAISEVGNIDDCGTTLCGDIDGDGQIEILAPIITDDVKFSKIGIFNSQAKAKRIIDVPTCSAFINIAIAKVKVSDSEYKTLIFFLAYDRYLYAYDPNGSQFWKSDQQFTSHSGEAVAIASLSLADFNHDGWTEIYIGPEIFDAATGKRLAKYNGNKGHSDRAWKASRQSYQSVVADVLGDDKLELILGNTACSVEINSRMDESQNSIMAVNSVPAANMKMEDNSNIPSTDGHTLLADMDGDGKLDVVVMHIDKTNRVIYIYVWNPRTGSMICTKKITNAAEFGTPNVGDIDHDGNLELNFIIGTYSGETTDANDKIYSLKYNKATHNLEVFWTLHHDDASGSTGLSLFDFNQDGTMEIVYRDCEHLRIINGSKIHHITGNPVAAPYDLANIPCTSGTGVEYPVIADVDADGEAEIVVVGNGSKLVIYESDLAPWAPARSVWNQFAYNITNVNEDLTIPTYIYNNAHIFTDVSSTTRQPFNNFLAQTTTINTQGVPFIAAADVNVSTTTTTTYENDSIKIDISFCNQGDLQVNAPYCITAYKDTYRGSVLFVDTIKAVLPIGDCLSHQVGFPISDVCSDKDINTIVIAVNDDGHGIAQHGNQQAECDTTNNRTSVSLPTDFRSDTTKYAPVICATELPYTFTPTGTIFPVGATSGRTIIPETNKYGCDSIIAIDLTVNPILYGDTFAVVYHANTYEWYGETFTTEGNYPHTLSSKVTGCDSIITLHLTFVPYPDNVEDVECVVPPIPSNFEIKEIYKVDGVHSMATPLVADLDGDGKTEIICSKWPDEKLIYGSDGFLIIDGITGLTKDTLHTCRYPICGQPISIADVDGDGKCEIFLSDLDNYAYCYSYTGTLKWKSSFALDGTYIPLLGHITDDEIPELFFGKYIFNPVTGTLLHEIALTPNGTGWGAPHGVGDVSSNINARGYHLGALADVDKDGKVEYCAGSTIYKLNITNPNGQSGNSSSVFKQAESIAAIHNYDGQTLIVDFDNDGQQDICVLGLPKDLALTSPQPEYNIYVWNSSTGSILAHEEIVGVGQEPKDHTWVGLSIPYCGDLNGDGFVDLTFSAKGLAMYTYTYDATSPNHMRQVHNYAPFNETCGYTVFDFNMDGNAEIVYRGTHTLNIVDGSTLTPLSTPTEAFSGTVTEYPVVADVNGDGQADIIIHRGNYEWPDRTKIREDIKGWVSVYSAASSGSWSSARSVWNQWAYNSININDDMSVPQHMYDVSTIYPNGTKPFNSFLAQKPIIDQQGDIFVPAADAAVTSCNNSIQNDSIEITVNFCNNGDANLVAPFEVTTYKNAYRGEVIKTDTIYQTLTIGNCTSLTTKIPVEVLCSNKEILQLLIAINDDGHGIAQHGNQQAECDTTNNRTSVSLPTDFRSDTTKYAPVICATELPYTFTPTGTIFPVGSTSGRTIIPETNKYGCDSIIAIDLTVNPILTGDTTATFCNGKPFVWHGTSYPTGGDYPYTYTSKVTGCDSVVTLHLTQLEPTDSIENVTLCAGSTHTWHGQTFTSSTTITETIPNAAGCDSVCTLNLTILPALTGDTTATFCNGTPFIWHGTSYATGGDYPYTYTSKVAPYCDSIVTLHLTQLEPTDSVEIVTICYGETHEWHGQTFTASTTKTVTIDNAAGCDSVCTLNLTVLPALTGDTTATFCNGTPFVWHGTSYPTGGDYPYTYTSKIAPYCDSIVTLHLTQLEPTDSIENVTLCAGGSYIWHGQTFTSSTTITETIPNAAGCDSVCTLNLTILPALTGDTSATFCSGKSFTWHGTQYSVAGHYPYTYTSKVAPYCDSIVTLHLTQLGPTDSVENVTLCYGESHVWHGQTFTTSTTITETIPNAAGCDSVCTLNLTILPALTGDTSATFCNGTPFIWHDTPYATGGDYQYTYTSKVAPYCDSIVTLHLTKLEPTDSIEVVTICYGGSHTWHGHTYTATTTTTETIDNAVGCDSVCTLKLTVLPAITGDTNMSVCDTLLPVTWRGQSITEAGEYYHTATASNGCDSTITLHVTVETCLPPALTCDTLEATLIVPDICADDDSMYIDITYTKGLPVSYNVTFGADAVAQGFQSSYSGNVRITSSTTASISIPIPNDPTNRQVYPKPNVYSIDISILDTCDAYTIWNSQDFLIHYPSWLTLQRWNDVISLYNERYNGGYVFSQIRWFHEGTLLESRGDHDGYIYQRPTLVYGDAYWAELTRADDGVTITTCPIYPVPMTDSTKMDDVTDPYIIVTPTVVTPSNPTVTVKTNICGEYYVYYVDGHLLDKQNFCPKDNYTFTIDIDPCYVRTGLYILVFYGEEGTIKAVKLLVEP